VCDYAFAGATKLETLYDDSKSYANPRNVDGKYFGKGAFAGCTALNMEYAGNGGESKAFYELNYIGDYCFDGCTNWGAGNSKSNIQGTNLIIYGFPKAGGYIGTYAFRGNGLGIGLSFADYTYPPYLHENAFSGYTRLYFFSNNIMIKDGAAGRYYTNLVDRINANPEIKTMYQNTYAL
jgi:hypothetical protein